jgi:mono/diheme cytochrome c family protein
MQLRKLAVIAGAAIAAYAADTGTPSQQDAAPVPNAAGTKEGAAAPAAKPLDVKSTFRNICGFCHEDYGRKAGKGPQLMDNPNSDEFLFNRIKNGKPGRMAAFGSVFTDDQIKQIVVFIRQLKPGEQP